MQKSEITERREPDPAPAASFNDIESPSNGALDLDENEEVISRRSFQVAPPIAPPIPDVQAFLQATKDLEDELEEKDGVIIKKEIAAGRLRLDKPSNSNNNNGEDNTDEETGGRDDASNDEEQHSSSRRQQGEPSVLRNNVVTTEEESESINSTVVYDGSIARVEAVLGSSSPPTTNSESINSQQPAFHGSSRPLEIPEAYLVTSTMVRSRFPWMTRTSLPIAVHAEPIQPWYKQPWGIFIAGVVILLVCALIIFTGVHVSQKKGDPLEATSAPSFAPTFDPSPTLDIVRSRGELWCGLDPEQNSTTPIGYVGFTTDLVCLSHIMVISMNI